MTRYRCQECNARFRAESSDVSPEGCPECGSISVLPVSQNWTHDNAERGRLYRWMVQVDSHRAKPTLDVEKIAQLFEHPEEFQEDYDEMCLEELAAGAEPFRAEWECEMSKGART